jgi:hypothetical protein
MFESRKLLSVQLSCTQHESGIGMQDAFCLRLNLRHLRRVAPPAPRLLAALGELLGTANIDGHQHQQARF